MKTKTTPKRKMNHRQPRALKRPVVDFLVNAHDLLVALMGAQGFATVFIEEKTGLSAGQISYRLRKAQVRRADYRDGINPVAQALTSGKPQKQSAGDIAGHYLARLFSDELGRAVVYENGCVRLVDRK